MTKEKAQGDHRSQFPILRVFGKKSRKITNRYSLFAFSPYPALFLTLLCTSLGSRRKTLRMPSPELVSWLWLDLASAGTSTDQRPEERRGVFPHLGVTSPGSVSGSNYVSPQ